MNVAINKHMDCQTERLSVSQTCTENHIEQEEVILSEEKSY